jgi:hypothetical protein
MRAEYLEDLGIIELLREGLVMAAKDVDRAGDVSSVGKQGSGHGVPHVSPHADQRKADAGQATRHGRDMARLGKMHNLGFERTRKEP